MAKKLTIMLVAAAFVAFMAPAWAADCVEVDIEITPTAAPVDEVTFSGEVTNCGTEPATVELAFEFTGLPDPFGDIEIRTVYIPIGAGETLFRSFTGIVPEMAPAGTYEVCVTATIGSASDDDCATLEITESVAMTAKRPRLRQNYPNPFNPETMIEFSLSSPSKVEVSIFNVLGEKVATLADGYYPAGRHTVSWDADGTPSGVYFYRLMSDAGVQTKKMILTR